MKTQVFSNASCILVSCKKHHESFPLTYKGMSIANCHQINLYNLKL